MQKITPDKTAEMVTRFTTEDGGDFALYSSAAWYLQVKADIAESRKRRGAV